ncbi:hypothetical protein PVL29_007979 [Vitis rotundifolia]|uniref:Uncharacterized protein n=1 Tax=Vitis rotundifolia TaxID=103349 RepID=A0AA39A1P9_VITRO|nr:hypothetical protein PVL29_007979 [Vitis rotundifolia]
MANDTPSTTTTIPHIRPNWRWFSYLRLKTTLSAELGGSVDLSTTLIFTALYNISTGFLFGIPMPVQPMKSIIVIAISDFLLSLPHITVVGFSTAATLFIFGATSFMSLLYHFIPSPHCPRHPALPGPRLRLLRHQIHPNWLGLDEFALALFSTLFLVLVIGSGDFGDEVIPLGVHEEENDSVNHSCRHVRRRLRIMSSIPAALIVFILGLVLCFIRDPSIVKDLQFGPSRIHLREDWKIGFFL